MLKQEKEKVKIQELGRTKKPSLYEPGRLYTITSILTTDGRQMVAYGSWSENWKKGDEIMGVVETKIEKTKKGNLITDITIKNPLIE